MIYEARGGLSCDVQPSVATKKARQLRSIGEYAIEEQRSGQLRNTVQSWGFRDLEPLELERHRSEWQRFLAAETGHRSWVRKLCE